jgi:SNF2 family DNA or RNA helicase
MTSAYKKLTLDDFHEYQLASVDHLFRNEKCGLFLDMGLGKTVITLTFLNKAIYEELAIDRTLMIGPKRVVESVWAEEAQKWAHLSKLKFTKLIGHQKQRDKALLENTDIHLISRDNIAWLCGKFGGHMPYDTLVIDESSSFKSPKSQRFKSLRLVVGQFKRVIILTGTPAPNGLIDLWPQIYLLDKGDRLGKTITSYRDEFFKPDARNGAVIFNYKIQPTGEERIHARISDICLSMRAKDYLTLPQRINNYIELKFDDVLQKKYDDFERDKILEFIDSGVELTAVNAAGMVNKLLQFANGAIYYEDADLKKEYMEVHDMKLDALEEIMDIDDKPVLVFYSYRHDLERIQAKFQKYKPRKLETNQDIDDWNAGKIRLLIMHPASGGHGLNLQYGGNTVVWFGIPWSLELYQQANARLDRQGQVNGVIVNHLVACKTYDMNVIRSLSDKDRTQESLMEAVKFKIETYRQTMNTL